MSTLQQSCQDYLSNRTSDYAFRCIRFSVVASRLYNMGASWSPPGPDGVARPGSIMDLGAGRQDFERFMRHTGWVGRYYPVDGGIDGTDLNHPWHLSSRVNGPEFAVAIEIVEHLHNPLSFLDFLETCFVGAVLTTPNPATVDVLGCDPTHICEIPAELLLDRGWNVEERGLFGNNPTDTLVAWHGGR